MMNTTGRNREHGRDGPTVLAKISRLRLSNRRCKCIAKPQAAVVTVGRTRRGSMDDSGKSVGHHAMHLE